MVMVSLVLRPNFGEERECWLPLAFMLVPTVWSSQNQWEPTSGRRLTQLNMRPSWN